MDPKSNLLEFLGVEENNLLLSLVKISDEFKHYETLDGIFKKPGERLKADTKAEATLSQLYLFVHFHLYFSLACLLRGHLSESFSSTRKAIDASLSAYRIIEDPKTAEKYLIRDKEFQYIKSVIERERKGNPKKFPLADGLIKAHNLCSQYGSHADITGFVDRLSLKKGADGDLPQMFLNYFQYPKSDREYRFQWVCTLLWYLLMFQVFKVWFDQKFKVRDPFWESKIEALFIDLEKLFEALKA